MKTIKIYSCDYWNRFDLNSPFVKILRKHYDVIFDSQEPDFLFYSCVGMEHIRFKNCVKIFFTNEAVEPDFNECDYAIGYSPMKFGERYYQKNTYIDFSTKDLDYNLANRKFCNFIYSQDWLGEGAWLRKNFCQMLMKYKHVDAPGRILNNMKDAITPRHGDWARGKLDFIKNYKFTIAIENTEMEGYITEKLWQPLQMHSIPIYWGAPDVGKYVNTESFIHLRDFKCLEDAIEYIDYIDNNDEEYIKILKTNPNLVDCNEETLEAFLCKIIERGNNPFPKNPLMAWEPKLDLLLDNTVKLTEAYSDLGNIKKAKEIAEICLFLDTRRRIDIYPLLEDIYDGYPNELLDILDKQKDTIIKSRMINHDSMRELCKIATCYVHMGKTQVAESLVEYVVLCQDLKQIKMRIL